MKPPRFCVLFVLLYTTLPLCKAEDDPDVRTAALLIGAENASKQSQSLSDLSQSARIGASGAVAASTVAGSGLNSSSSFFRPRSRQRLVQIALGRALREAGLPGIILPAPGSAPVARALPTDFACTGAPSNNCDNGTLQNDYDLNGTENCSLGGTVTANNVPINLQQQNSLFRYEMSEGGNFTFSNCGVLNVDYNNFPEFAAQQLSGQAELTGAMISSITETPSTFSGFFFGQTTVTTTTADNFTVNGSAPQILELYTDSTFSFNMLFDPNTEEPISGIVSGTVYLSGNANGENVDLKVKFVEDLGD